MKIVIQQTIHSDELKSTLKTIFYNTLIRIRDITVTNLNGVKELNDINSITIQNIKDELQLGFERLTELQATMNAWENKGKKNDESSEKLSERIQN